MGIVVGAFEAKTKLAELLDKVEAGESVTITRHGKAVAQMADWPLETNVLTMTIMATMRICLMSITMPHRFPKSAKPR